MKKYTTVFYIILMSCFSSCESSWFDEYVVKNETNHTIQIIAYFDNQYSGKLKPEIHNIAPQKEVITLKSVGFKAQDGGIFINAFADSIQIIFDNNRVITQSCHKAPLINAVGCKIDRNLMRFSNPNYTISSMSYRKGSKRGTRYEYIITEQDYQRSSPLK
jgi:hypothetical protein